MSRRSLWSRIVIAALLPLLVLVAGFVPVSTVRAVGCGEAPQLPAATAQATERWRYTYEGAGGYELIGWTPTEATVLVNAPGCALSRMAVVELNLLSGAEMWRVTADQLQGPPEYGITTASGMVVLSTPKAIYAYDETTGQQLWVASHAFAWAPEFVANENNVISLAFDNEIIGLIERSGVLLWHTMLPTGSIADWENIPQGALVGLGRPDTAGQDVMAFGVDQTSGSVLWQTSVGTTVSSTGGMLNLTGNATGLLAADITTDGTTALVVLDGASGAIQWTAPLASDTVLARSYVTGGPQPVVIYATGDAQETKIATAYDGISGAQLWQNQNIGIDAIVVDDTHLAGAGPALSYPNALVLVDAITGEMVWSQPYALVEGGFTFAAQLFGEQLIYTPPANEASASTVMGIDLATGNVTWANSFPEFDGVFVEGLPAGLVMVSGDAATEAVLVALAP